MSSELICNQSMRLRRHQYKLTNKETFWQWNNWTNTDMFYPPLPLLFCFFLDSLCVLGSTVDVGTWFCTQRKFEGKCRREGDNHPPPPSWLLWFHSCSVDVFVEVSESRTKSFQRGFGRSEVCRCDFLPTTHVTRHVMS